MRKYRINGQQIFSTDDTQLLIRRWLRCPPWQDRHRQVLILEFLAWCVALTNGDAADQEHRNWNYQQRFSHDFPAFLDGNLCEPYPWSTSGAISNWLQNHAFLSECWKSPVWLQADTVSGKLNPDCFMRNSYCDFGRTSAV
jgi:hypothetical protein